jgi:protocatechuate 3,4-dioxygenase beta subunit
MKSLFLIAFFQAALTGQTVQGLVVDATTGAPLGGAYVSVYGVKPLVTRTDAGGLFRLEGATGPVQVTRPGYLESSNAAQRKGQDLSIRLTPEAVISGKLEDEDGFPVEGALVHLVQYREINGERRLSQVRWGRSNDLGEYRIGGVAAGRYYLRVSNGNAMNWDGRYVSQFFGGTAQLSDEHMVEVKAGEHRDATDMRLLKFEGVTLSGRLEGYSRSTSRQQMPWIRLRSDAGLMDYSSFTTPVQPDGTFLIRHVTPGRYTLVAQTGNGSGQAGDLLAKLPVEVNGLDVRDLVLTLHVVQAVDVPGTIVVDGGGTPVRMSISLRGNMGPGVTARSEEDGSFVLKGLLPGHYGIQAVPDFFLAARMSGVAAGKPPILLLATSVRLGEEEVLQKGIEVDSQPLGAMKITLGKPATISGKIVDAAGQPVAGQMIYFLSPAGTAGTISDAEGAFQALPRVAGEYHVYALPDQSAAADPDYLKEHEKDFPVVRVVAGENPPIVLRWTKGQSK